VRRGILANHWWQRSADFGALSHAGLDSQLRPLIGGRDEGPAVRALAIEMARDCRVESLGAVLAKVALDGSEPAELRLDAAEAVGRLKNSEARLALRALVDSAAADLDDDLRAQALKALCPEIVSPSQAFAMLADGTKGRHVFGTYSRFVYELGSMLTEAHLPDALIWLGNQPSRRKQRYSHAHLCETVLRLAWHHGASPTVAAHLAPAVVHCWRNHDALITADGSELRGERRAPEIEHAARRNVLLELCKVSNLSPSDLASNARFGSPCIVLTSDVGWILDQLAHEEVPQTRARLLALLTRAARDVDKVDELERLLLASENSKEVAAALQDLFDPMELDSPATQRTRSDYLQMQEFRRPRPVAAGIDRGDRIAALLRMIETGEVAHWMSLANAILFWSDNDGRPISGVSPLIGSPYWESADPQEKSRVAQAAKAYLQAAECGTNDYGASEAASGFLAFQLLAALEARWLRCSWSEFDLQRWVPAVIAHCTPQSSELVSLLYDIAPERTVAGIRAELERESKTGASVHAHQLVDAFWDQRVADMLLALASSGGLSIPAEAELIARGIMHKDSRFVELGRALLNDGSADRDRVAAVISCALAYGARELWSSFWSRTEVDSEFGAKVMCRLPMSALSGNASIVRSLSVLQVAEFYRWLRAMAPYRSDPHEEGSAVEDDDTIKPLQELRRETWRSLVECGHEEAVVALQAMAREFPDDQPLQSAWLVALEEHVSKTWRQPSPEEALALVRSRDARLVDGGKELLDVLMESLQRIQQKLHGETPEAQFLWDSRGGWYPKEETALSDYIKRRLEDDLNERGILLQREVEIRRSVGDGSGQRIDIRASTLQNDPRRTSAEANAIIEVKGCWNSDLRRSMQDQLKARYLRHNLCRHGLFLCVWFGKSRWNEDDSRRAKAPSNKDDVKRYLEQQASELSTDGVAIRSFLLDASLL
jgi:hypothetical protein